MRDHGFEQGAEGAEGKTKEKLDSWKEIAAYLGREVRTAQRWEKLEGLPVHRHHHYKLGSVYAYRSELEAWIKQRQTVSSAPAAVTDAAAGVTAATAAVTAAAETAGRAGRGRKFRGLVVLSVVTIMVIAGGAGYVLVSRTGRRGALPAAIPGGKSEAVAEYLKGRYAWHKGTEADLEKSLGFFQRARELDPNFPLAHAGIAEAYVALAINGMRRPRDCFPMAQEAAEKAAALDESVAEAHTAMAQIKCYWNWDWAGAEQEFLRALDLGPGLATAHHAYAHFLSEMGRENEALAQVKRAQELEPLSAAINSDAGWFYFRA